ISGEMFLVTNCGHFCKPFDCLGGLNIVARTEAKVESFTWRLLLGSMAQAKIFFFELSYVVTPNPGAIEGGPEIGKFFDIVRRDIRRFAAGLSHLQCSSSQRVEVQSPHGGFLNRLPSDGNPMTLHQADRFFTHDFYHRSGKLRPVEEIGARKYRDAI